VCELRAAIHEVWRKHTNRVSRGHGRRDRPVKKEARAALSA
jgi:hypothetical protein